MPFTSPDRTSPYSPLAISMAKKNKKHSWVCVLRESHFYYKSCGWYINFDIIKKPIGFLNRKRVSSSLLSFKRLFFFRHTIRFANRVTCTWLICRIVWQSMNKGALRVFFYQSQQDCDNWDSSSSSFGDKAQEIGLVLGTCTIHQRRCKGDRKVPVVSSLAGEWW